MKALPWPRIAKAGTPTLLIFLSLVVLRVQLGYDYEFAFADMLSLQIWMGWIFDLAAALTIDLFVTLLGLIIPGASTWRYLPIALLVWIANLSNVLHFRFFEMRLDLWVVTLHWRDLTAVQGSATSLGTTPLIILSILLFVAALIASWFVRHSHLPSYAPSLWRGRWIDFKKKELWALLVLVVFTGLAWRMPVWLNPKEQHLILRDQIIRTWYYQATHKKLFVGAGTGWMNELKASAGEHDFNHASQVLAKYRDLSCRGAACRARLFAPTNGISEGDDKWTDDKWPLWRWFEPNPETVTGLRDRLGLPLGEKPNIIMLFVESLRAFELDHPELGPQILPNLRQELDEHAIYFTQAYSSSFTAGQTVRGQFSTFCSMLPNIAGAATYIAHSTVRVSCLQDLATQAGYKSVWLNSHTSNFHGKREFEMRHGTTEFFDGAYFESQGVDEKIGKWGLADTPFLQEVIHTLEKEDKETDGFFANVLTISTHHPYTYLPGKGEIP
ncbi:sulfatase-like hydrolase/transferase, partial [Myxococcota bacterium]|nr:sulfatase-like hydrolase/transferase [Myxococcota bacterium]